MRLLVPELRKGPYNTSHPMHTRPCSALTCMPLLACSCVRLCAQGEGVHVLVPELLKGLDEAGRRRAAAELVAGWAGRAGSEVKEELQGHLEPLLNVRARLHDPGFLCFIVCSTKRKAHNAGKRALSQCRTLAHTPSVTHPPHHSFLHAHDCLAIVKTSQSLISLLSDDDKEVVAACWRAVDALVNTLPKEDREMHLVGCDSLACLERRRGSGAWVG